MKGDRVVGYLTKDGKTHRIEVWNGDYWVAPTIATTNGSRRHVGRVIREYLERGYKWTKEKP